MKLTILNPDNMVIVDDVAHTIDLTAHNLDSNIHAIQFDTTAGEVEYRDDTPNTAISNIDQYQAIIDEHAALVQLLAPPPVTPVDLAERKRQSINAAYEQAMLPISLKYPRSEIDGWPRQTAEADKYRLMEATDLQPPAHGDTNNFPVLANLAAIRGNTLLEQVIRVEQKAAEFDQFYGSLTGMRQALEDALETIDLNGPEAESEINAVDESALTTLSEQLLGA